VAPSEHEIAAARKAYQRIRVFSRQPSSLFFIVCLLIIGIADINDWAHHHGKPPYTVLVFAALLIISQIIQRVRYRRDSALLNQFTATYGEEGRRLAREAPRSCFYYIFQKQYPPVTRGDWRSLRDPLAVANNSPRYEDRPLNGRLGSRTA